MRQEQEDSLATGCQVSQDPKVAQMPGYLSAEEEHILVCRMVQV